MRELVGIFLIGALVFLLIPLTEYVVFSEVWWMDLAIDLALCCWGGYILGKMIRTRNKRSKK